MNRVVVAIAGPTASGKTALSIKLAERFNAQIVCCDSRTVYRYMDIGTAKPSPVERRRVPHHMLDIVEPDQNYTAAQYANDVRQVIAAIHNDGCLPIICGGTGLYFKAALEGLQIPQVPPNAELRKHLNDLADREGNIALHTQLQKLDPKASARIHVNDRFRLVRALEVSLATGVPFSRAARLGPSPYDILWIGLNAEDRSFLQAQIHSRLQQQMECGLLSEVASLYHRWGECETLLNTINYSEFIACLTGKITEAQARQLCLKNNCRLARRQIMWFKRNQNINWLFIDRQTPPALFSQAAELVAAKLHSKNSKAG